MFGKKEKTTVLNVKGMTCHHCEMNVENSLKGIENITDVKADHKNSKIEIQYSGEINEKTIKDKIIEAGYEVI
jgi:copper chaperone